jgi:hypothetical protein
MEGSGQIFARETFTRCNYCAYKGDGWARSSSGHFEDEKGLAPAGNETPVVRRDFRLPL